MKILHPNDSDSNLTYLTEDNLMPDGNQFDTSEAGRIGTLLGATHVLCVSIRDWQQYPPQVLSLSVTMVDCASLQPILEMDATFDASEQQVVMALADHLQRREARKYSSHGLDILLHSPSKYATFVASQCNRELFRQLWPQIELKKPSQQTDTNEGRR